MRDSSLSACTQAVMAAETGHLDLAYDYLAEAALMDLEDLGHNTRDGLHLASLAGTWIALVSGLGGMRERAGTLSFAPRIPEGLSRLAFGLVFRGRHLRVDATPGSTTYQLTRGTSLELLHFGEPTVVSGRHPVVCTTPPGPSPRSAGQPAQQPFGRQPVCRHAQDHVSSEERRRQR